jgi:protein-S-isoprenylcysteine O-methyltransferase Ste14
VKDLSTISLKVAGFLLVLLCWRCIGRHALSLSCSLAWMWGTVALVPGCALLGRRLLERRPTPERAALITLPVHYSEMVLLGCALIVAFRVTQEHPIAAVAVPRAISSPLLKVFGLLASLAVVNLAIRGSGLPFAAVLSKRLATDWLYARSRNPMLLFSLLFFVVGAVWLQSLHAILWTILWLTPAWILYVRLYEERELEIRFGESYLHYKARTPFF